jgi:hypothetical protein
MNVEDILEAVGGEKEFSENNGLKFCLSEIEPPNSDRYEVLNLWVRETRYNTIQSVLFRDPEAYERARRTVKSGQPIPEDVFIVPRNPALRRRYASLEPHRHRIPHALCLHFVARFIDGSLLCMQRKPDTPYYPGAWSFSAEEQLKDVDFSFAKDVASWWMRRTALEEVFLYGSYEPGIVSNRWAEIEGMVDFMRLWSINLEWDSCNWSAFGIIGLNITPDELRAFLIDHRPSLQDDQEGMLCSTPRDEVDNLLMAGRCKVFGLINGTERTVTVEDLHPTSRYRLWRLRRASH